MTDIEAIRARFERLLRESIGSVWADVYLSDVGGALAEVDRLTAEATHLARVIRDRDEWNDHLADQVAALTEALRDVFTLLPPDRVRLIRPSNDPAIRSVFGSDGVA